MISVRSSLALQRVALGCCLAMAVATTPACADGVIYLADIFYPDWSNGYIYAVNTDGTGLHVIHDTGGDCAGWLSMPEQRSCTGLTSTKT